MTDAQTHAWIFLSVPDQPAPLQDVIAMADGINHAIPTEKELEVSLGWLLAQGLIRKEERNYSLTESGIALRKAASAKTMMKTWDAVTVRFAKIVGPNVPWDDVSPAEIGAAYKGYKKWFWTAYEKLREKDKPA